MTTSGQVRIAPLQGAISEAERQAWLDLSDMIHPHMSARLADILAARLVEDVPAWQRVAAAAGMRPE